MKLETLLFDVADGVARITLNRPDHANSLDRAMGMDLMQVAIRCDEDPAIRAVLLTGAGRMFCGGGDLATFAAQGEGLPSYIKETTTYLHAAVSRFARMDAPLIAAVNGSAGGAGLSLVCACDLVLAAESAKLTMAYTRIGFTPDGGSTFYLPRIVGMRRALELALTNRVLTAAEAAELGIVTRVVPDAHLEGEARALAAELAAGPTAALGGAKRLLYGSFEQSLETQMELEARAIAAASGTADGREGMAAFLEKRAAEFGG
jgi:2-(1,2-epoxy-1,2-dihydrophenyl)acetyl-CoA isomerase